MHCKQPLKHGKCFSLWLVNAALWRQVQYVLELSKLSCQSLGFPLICPSKVPYTVKPRTESILGWVLQDKQTFLFLFWFTSCITFHWQTSDMDNEHRSVNIWSKHLSGLVPSTWTESQSPSSQTGICTSLASHDPLSLECQWLDLRKLYESICSVINWWV